MTSKTTTTMTQPTTLQPGQRVRILNKTWGCRPCSDFCKVLKVTSEKIEIQYNHPGSLWHLSTVTFDGKGEHHFTGPFDGKPYTYLIDFESAK